MVTRLNVAVAECDLVQGNIYIKVNTYIQNNIFTGFSGGCVTSITK